MLSWQWSACRDRKKERERERERTKEEEIVSGSDLKKGCKSGIIGRILSSLEATDFPLRLKILWG
jgi:hypothetical protein